MLLARESLVPSPCRTTTSGYREYTDRAPAQGWFVPIDRGKGARSGTSLMVEGAAGSFHARIAGSFDQNQQTRPRTAAAAQLSDAPPQKD